MSGYLLEDICKLEYKVKVDKVVQWAVDTMVYERDIVFNGNNIS